MNVFRYMENECVSIEQTWLLNLWDAFYKRPRANFEHEVRLHPGSIFTAQIILFLISIISIAGFNILLLAFLAPCILEFCYYRFLMLSSYSLLYCFSNSRVIILLTYAKILITFKIWKLSQRGRNVVFYHLFLF